MTDDPYNQKIEGMDVSVFELDGSDIPRPMEIWRNSWQTMRGLVVGGRQERSERSFEIVPNVPIPKGAVIGRRSEVRWKPGYPDRH